MPEADLILDFSHLEGTLSASSERLQIRGRDQPLTEIPFTEIAVVILASNRLSTTQAALARLCRAKAAIVLCDDNYLPVGMLQPIHAHTVQVSRMVAQAAVSLPTKKRLWKAIVIHKILSQAMVLESRRGSDHGLRMLAKGVRSGDPANVESTAAQRYWPALFDSVQFRRRRDAPDQNRLLNYGYAILRAAVARAICAAGLHPSLGVHHHARSDAFCLADDLMEPYRPLVDDAVVELVGCYGEDVGLSSAVRKALAEVLHARIDHNGESMAVLDHLQRTASSLAHVFLGNKQQVYLPEGLTRA